MQHYNDKLLSIADGNFDSHYRRRFWGRGTDGASGFKTPGEDNDTGCYFLWRILTIMHLKWQAYHNAIKREYEQSVTS